MIEAMFDDEWTDPDPAIIAYSVGLFLFVFDTSCEWLLEALF